MTCLTVLPHSSACVERIFSQGNSVKTSKINSLKATTTRVLAKQHLTKHGQSCITWEPEKELLQELSNGGVYRRYEARLKEAKEAEKIEIYEGDDKEEH